MFKFEFATDAKLAAKLGLAREPRALPPEAQAVRRALGAAVRHRFAPGVERLSVANIDKRWGRATVGRATLSVGLRPTPVRCGAHSTVTGHLTHTDAGDDDADAASSSASAAAAEE